MPPIFFKGATVDYGNGSSGALNVTSGTTTLSANANYTTGSISSGAILVIPPTISVKFNGTLTNNGTITGGDAATAGTGASYDPTTTNDLLPTSSNGATSTNSASFVGRAALKILAKNLVNNGIISTSGSTSTATDAQGQTIGINGNGAGFILIIAESISGSGSLAAAGGGGETGHAQITYSQTCSGTGSGTGYYNNAAYTSCASWSGDTCSGNYNNRQWYTAASSGTYTYYYTYYYDCSQYYAPVANGTSGPSSSIRIITGSVPTGGTSSGQTVVTTVSSLAAGTVLWFDKKSSLGSTMSIGVALQEN